MSQRQESKLSFVGNEACKELWNLKKKLTYETEKRRSLKVSVNVK